MNSIENTLSVIKEQIGLELILCEYFTGIRKHGSKEYFNVELKDRAWNSIEYTSLERLVQKGIVSKVEPNGVTRVAIYF